MIEWKSRVILLTWYCCRSILCRYYAWPQPLKYFSCMYAWSNYQVTSFCTRVLLPLPSRRTRAACNPTIGWTPLIKDTGVNFISDYIHNINFPGATQQWGRRQWGLIIFFHPRRMQLRRSGSFPDLRYSPHHPNSPYVNGFPLPAPLASTPPKGRNWETS